MWSGMKKKEAETGCIYCNLLEVLRKQRRKTNINTTEKNKKHQSV
jgi:hypothetical protein